MTAARGGGTILPEMEGKLPANAKQLFVKLQSLKTLTGEIAAHIGSCCDVLGKTNTQRIDKLPIGNLPILVSRERELRLGYRSRFLLLS